MNLLKFHGLIHENIHEKVLKFVLLLYDISCTFHGSSSSSGWTDRYTHIPMNVPKQFQETRCVRACGPRTPGLKIPKYFSLWDNKFYQIIRKKFFCSRYYSTTQGTIAIIY